MNEFKQFIKVIAFVIVCGVTIIASAGCLNYAAVEHEGFYTVIGILNFGWLYLPIREAVKYFKACTAAKKENEGNKTDSAKQ